MKDIRRIDLENIDFDNVAAWLCGDELTEAQKADVLKLQITYDMATMRKKGVEDDFWAFEVKK
ncbi:MAG: hypothetical protein K6G12_09780 [Lachnospiraceae bacterium]|nr:hypothetical protein [Lachnospiraceae bacterium]